MKKTGADGMGGAVAGSAGDRVRGEEWEGGGLAAASWHPESIDSSKECDFVVESDSVIEGKGVFRSKPSQEVGDIVFWERFLVRLDV